MSSFIKSIIYVSIYIYFNSMQASQNMWFKNDYDESSSIIRQHFLSINSTQIVARQQADDAIRGHDIPTFNCWKLITANEQTAGIAQYSRSWSSPANVNIYATYTVPWPEDKSALLFHLAQVVTVAMADVTETINFKPKIKWINDLLLNNKKLCGILCESRGKIIDTNICLVLIGIGFNVNMSKDICDQLDQPVTSLLVESGREWNKEHILSVMNKHLFCTLSSLLKYGFESIHPRLLNRMAFIDEKITVQDEKEIYEGIFKGITANGQLILKIEDKELTLFTGRIIRKVSK